MRHTEIQQVKPRMAPLIVLWFAVFSTWAISGILLHGMQERGTFGDMFGAVNALFSGLAFATLIYTAWMQRDELALQRAELAATRAELEGQKLQLQIQSQTFSLQRFEDTFFALLRMHGDIVNAMDLVDEFGNTTKSRDCFRVWYKRLKVRYKDPLDQGCSLLEAAQLMYAEFYKKHQAELGHYFRHLYHIIKFVKEAPVEEKKKYTSLIRAQLSAYEHLMLFYNGLSEYGIEKFKPLIDEYELLENLPQRLLITPEHKDLYTIRAYGSDGVY